MKQREAMGIDELELMAAAIYEAGEDLADEAVAAKVAAGDRKAMKFRDPRVSWEHCTEEVQEACRRRARAAFAAMQLSRKQLRIPSY